MLRCFLILFIAVPVFGQNSMEYFHRALSFQHQRQFDSAFFFYEKSQSLQWDSVVRLNEAHAYAGSGDFVKAFSVSREVASGGNPLAWLYAARYAASAGMNDTAMVCLTRYCEVPGRLPDNVLKTDSSFRSLSLQSGWNELWTSHPQDDWLDLKADFQYSFPRKEYEHLFDVLDQALEKFADKDELFYMRFQVFYATQNYSGAEQNLKKAIKLKKDKPEYWLGYARLKSKMKDPKAAVKHFVQYNDLYPYDLLVYREWIAECLKAGDYKRAGELSDYFLRFFKKDPGMLFERAYSYEMQKEYKTAIAMYDDVLNINGRFTDAYFRKGMCYFELGDWENAFNEFTMAVDINPRSGELFYYRGITRLNKGDKVGACRDFERAKSFNYLQATEYMMKICKGM